MLTKIIVINVILTKIIIQIKLELRLYISRLKR